MAASDDGVNFRFQSISQLSHGLGRAYSATDLTEAVLRGLDGKGRRLNAVANLAWERAMDSARRCDVSRRRSGVLHGIPYGAKDVFSSAGVATTWSAPPFKDQMLPDDAAVIMRLERRKAILTAKLSSIQLAGAGGYRSPSTSLQGPGINPWNTAHWSGGSSSGPAIVVSAGLLPFALGTETTGSVVVPAAFCGVTGFRPTWGSVSQRGMLSVAWSLDKPGIIARSARDCQVVLRAVAGTDPLDPTTLVGSASPLRRRQPQRLGILERGPDGSDIGSPVFESALHVLESVGFEWQAIQLGGSEEHQRMTAALLRGETAASQALLVKERTVEGLLDPSQRNGLRSMAGELASVYAGVARERLRAIADIRRTFDHVDALVAPTSPSEAPLLEADLARWPSRRRHYGYLGALAGLPGISVPMGFGSNGLPLGLSIIADQYRDELVLAIADRYQGATRWHLAQPEAPL